MLSTSMNQFINLLALCPCVAAAYYRRPSLHRWLAHERRRRRNALPAAARHVPEFKAPDRQCLCARPRVNRYTSQPHDCVPPGTWSNTPPHNRRWMLCALSSPAEVSVCDTRIQSAGTHSAGTHSAGTHSAGTRAGTLQARTPLAHVTGKKPASGSHTSLQA